MTNFFGGPDAAAIVMKHCRESGQSFCFRPLDEDPRPSPENVHVAWRELNWNYTGYLGGGDRVYFESQEGFWLITLGALPHRGPSDEQLRETWKEIGEMQERNREKYRKLRAGD
jgi:hypothetical protein